MIAARLRAAATALRKRWRRRPAVEPWLSASRRNLALADLLDAIGGEAGRFEAETGLPASDPRCPVPGVREALAVADVIL